MIVKLPHILQSSLFQPSPLCTIQYRPKLSRLPLRGGNRTCYHYREGSIFPLRFPDKPQAAVFDTGFHSKMPAHAFMYGVPVSWYRDHHVRRLPSPLSHTAMSVCTDTASTGRVTSTWLARWAPACGPGPGWSAATSGPAAAWPRPGWERAPAGTPAWASPPSQGS